MKFFVVVAAICYSYPGEAIHLPNVSVDVLTPDLYESQKYSGHVVVLDVKNHPPIVPVIRAPPPPYTESSDQSKPFNGLLSRKNVTTPDTPSPLRPYTQNIFVFNNPVILIDIEATERNTTGVFTDRLEKEVTSKSGVEDANVQPEPTEENKMLLPVPEVDPGLAPSSNTENPENEHVQVSVQVQTVIPEQVVTETYSELVKEVP